MLKKNMQKNSKKILLLIILSLFIISNCASKKVPTTNIDRSEKIPTTAIKITPETDKYPPIIHSDEFDPLFPLGDNINTAGAEDSPFVSTQGGETLYFFFTPDVRIPPEKQVLDGVTGIYVSYKGKGDFYVTERIILQDKNKLALDGCEFVINNTILYFCSAREGYTGIHWFTAEKIDKKWTNWKNSDFNSDYEVGELHIDNNELYFHSAKSGGKGGLDIWVSRKLNNKWQQPVNLEIVNTKENEGWPYISPDGKELWFSRTYKGSPAIFRSKKDNNQWQSPELIISQFAGEPTLGINGNLYFVHHYFKDGIMIEADIYIATRSKKGRELMDEN